MSTRAGSPATLRYLPEVLQTRIIKYALSFQKPEVLSLENAPAMIRALPPISGGRFKLDKTLLVKQISTYLRANTFVIQYKIKHKARQLDGFDRLSKLLWTVQGTKRCSESYDITCPLIQYWPSATVNIIFELQDPSVTSLEDVSFDAMPLLLATLCIMPEKRFTVRLHNIGSTGKAIVQKEISSSSTSYAAPLSRPGVSPNPKNSTQIPEPLRSGSTGLAPWSRLFRSDRIWLDSTITTPRSSKSTWQIAPCCLVIRDWTTRTLRPFQNEDLRHIIGKIS